jgi:LysR family transcriptional regulator, transcriptional activator of nhaA
MTGDWLNYHHLYYFWVTARQGTLARASQELLVAVPTISGQIHALERSLGEPLFRRQGRGMVLTDAGRTVFDYANTIFRLGRELSQVIRQHPAGGPLSLRVGVDDALPKLVARRLIEPALHIDRPVRLDVRQDTTEQLLGHLAMHRLDVILSDRPAPATPGLRTFSHLLGESRIEFFAAAALARRWRRGFPGSLNGAPILLPGEGSVLRRSLDTWFKTQGLRPEIRGEFEDSGLLKTFGQIGQAAFPAPQIIGREVCRQYGVVRLGVAGEVRERFFAISVERKLQHPCVVAIEQTARRRLV